jgi:RNA polymerase sigma-70 factor, ECF subfamily
MVRRRDEPRCYSVGHQSRSSWPDLPLQIESVTRIARSMHSWLKMQLVATRFEPSARSDFRCDGSRTAAPSIDSKPGYSRDRSSDAELASTKEPFSEIYVRHFEIAWRTLRRYGVPVAELEDALQEVFLIVHDRLPSFEGRSSLKTWIFGVARRVARNHRAVDRMELCDPGILDELPIPGAANSGPGTEQHENARILYSLLAEISQERREILVLVELEQMTVAEAAEVLGENPNTLHSRLRAARVDLAAAWNRMQANADWRGKCPSNNRR